MLLDTHCHLDFDVFDADRIHVIENARNSGVRYQISISTSVANMPAVRLLSEAHESVFHSVGIHPCHVDEGLFTVDDLINLSQHPRCVGLGETGLDYFHNKEPQHLERQCDSFRRHMQAAQATGVPVIVHSRDCDEETVSQMEQVFTKKPFPFVIHCFTGSQAFADAVLAMGGYISVSGIATFKTAEALRAVIRSVPLERLLLETDSPYLAPGKHRGKRNEPAFVVETAAALAALKNVSTEEIAAITTANAQRLFKKLPQGDA